MSPVVANRSRHRPALVGRGPGFAALARLAPFLGEPETVTALDHLARSRMFEAVLHLLGRLAEQSPVLMVVEDLQWADRSTLDFLVFLMRSLARERVMIVATYRSTDVHPGHPLRAVLGQLDPGAAGRTVRPASVRQRRGSRVPDRDPGVDAGRGRGRRAPARTAPGRGRPGALR